MKKRGLTIAGGVVLLCLLLGVYILLKNKETEEAAVVEEEDEAEEIVSIPEDEIANLTFDMDDGEVTWVNEEDGWYLEEDENFPVDESKMSTLISSISSITPERTLDEVTNLKDYGLEEPVNVIKVEKTDESVETIYVGNKNPSTGDTYIYLNDEKETVYTIASDLGSKFSGDIYDFAVGEDYPSIVSSNITRISVDKEDNSYSLENDADSSTNYTVTDGEGNAKEADASSAGTLQSSTAALSFNGYYEYNCEDWEAYGLDDPKMKLTINYTEEEAVETDESDESDETEDVSENSDGDEEAVKQTVEKTLVLYVGSLNEEDNNYYVRLGDSQEVHGIAQSAISTLMNGKAFDYWKLSIEYIAISDLDHLDVTYNGETHTLKRVVTVEDEEEEEDEENAASADSTAENTDDTSDGSTAEAADDTSGNDTAEAADSTSSSDADDTSDDAADETADETDSAAATTTVYYVDDEEADSQTFMNFYRGALEMVCQSRLEAYEEQNEPELVLEYYGTDGSKVTIEYISRDSNFYTVTDTDGNYGLVNKMNVKDLVSLWIKLMNEQEKK